MPTVGEREFNPGIPFASQSWSNRLSSLRTKVDVNSSSIINEEYSISHNEIEENIALNLHDRNDIIMVDCVSPTIDEFDTLYNLYNYDIDYDNDTNVGMQENDIAFEDDIALDDDIELNHDKMSGDDEVNDAFESEPIVMPFSYRVLGGWCSCSTY
ncbi:hypothetical protein FNV43_RR27045 [Rhamnella rubrinervis]|uniref:Uncharacterized protein n=1 Tax=Rhamnella rubrinervis TaxID=2594499 RepID=A0A8K0DJV6_9ROSA|nr:hypothetical protein FNV43_RR27045 [Rhamnella rubrinervis]